MLLNLDAQLKRLPPGKSCFLHYLLFRYIQTGKPCMVQADNKTAYLIVDGVAHSVGFDHEPRRERRRLAQILGSHVESKIPVLVDQADPQTLEGECGAGSQSGPAMLPVVWASLRSVKFSVRFFVVQAHSTPIGRKNFAYDSELEPRFIWHHMRPWSWAESYFVGYAFQ